MPVSSPDGRACSAGTPLSFRKERGGKRKRRRGNEDASPSGPPPQCTPGGTEGTASAKVRTHIGGRFPPLKRGFGLVLAEAPGFDCRRERVLPFIDKLTGYLIGSRHCLWPIGLLQLLRLSAQPVGAYFEGAPGEPSPGPFFPAAFLRKRKRCPRRGGGSRRIGALPSPGRRSPPGRRTPVATPPEP